MSGIFPLDSSNLEAQGCVESDEIRRTQILRTVVSKFLVVHEGDNALDTRLPHLSRPLKKQRPRVSSEITPTSSIDAVVFLEADGSKRVYVELPRSKGRSHRLARFCARDHPDRSLSVEIFPGAPPHLRRSEVCCVSFSISCVPLVRR